MQQLNQLTLRRKNPKMSQTLLSYSGKLILETKTRTSVKHNHGTSNLFRLLTTILAKENFKTKTLPTYFMLYAAKPSDLLGSPYVSNFSSKALLYNFVDIISQSETNDANLFSATFTSTIDSSMIIGTTSDTHNNISLALVDGAQQNILAVVEFDEGTYGIINSGGQTFVKWVMTLANADDISAAAIANVMED